VTLTVLNLVSSVVLIRGLGPIPSFGTRGAAMGTVLSAGAVSFMGLVLLIRGRLVVAFPRPIPRSVDWGIVSSLFRFGLPAGIQGVVMNIGGLILLRFVGSLTTSAEAQAAYTIGYTQLFSLVSWTSVGLMGASAAAAGQSLGAGKPDRARKTVETAAGLGLLVAILLGTVFALAPGLLLSLFGMEDPVVLALGRQLLRFLSVSGLFVTVALAFTGGLQGTGDTRSPLWISLVAQLALPVGLCLLFDLVWGLEAWHIWLSIVLGHAARAGLSVSAFRRGKWADIKVSIRDTS
jgi:Na+-driven multidrug efflux pump